MTIKYPSSYYSSGHTTQTDVPGHILDMIEEVLLTAPAERDNRPTFGCGVNQLVFAPDSDALAGTQQKIIQASLQQWLSDLIRVNSVDVTAEDSTLLITIVYTIIQSQQQMTQQFVYGGATS
jgi:phage baseplate assembly protein W